VAKEQKQRYPLVFASAYPPEVGDGFSVAACDIIPLSRLLRSCAALWLANHQALMRQGYSPLDATRYLLAQTEGKQAQPPAQPNFAPMQSPFQQQPLMTGTNGR
jgi:hypothetical protein